MSTGPGVNTGGNVKINNLCQIGIGASIKDKVVIRKNTVVGGGAFVNKDCDSNSTYFGVPAKKIKKLNFMTYVIAEIGVNHNNNIKISKKIIDFCVREKVDAVKFQTFNAETLALENTPKGKIPVKVENDKESYFMMLKKLELSKRIISIY